MTQKCVFCKKQQNVYGSLNTQFCSRAGGFWIKRDQISNLTAKHWQHLSVVRQCGTSLLQGEDLRSLSKRTAQLALKKVDQGLKEKKDLIGSSDIFDNTDVPENKTKLEVSQSFKMFYFFLIDFYFFIQI